MNDLLQHWYNMVARLDGPLHVRFILQPLMASFFAIRDGVRDAHAGSPAYLWGLFHDPASRKARILDGWETISRVFFLAVALDVIYVLIVFHDVHPAETLLTACILAIVPYVLLRGPVKRIASSIMQRKLVERPHH